MPDDHRTGGALRQLDVMRTDSSHSDWHTVRIMALKVSGSLMALKVSEPRQIFSDKASSVRTWLDEWLWDLSLNG